MEVQGEVGLFQARRWRALAIRHPQDAELFLRVADKYARKGVADREPLELKGAPLGPLARFANEGQRSGRS